MEKKKEDGKIRKKDERQKEERRTKEKGEKGSSCMLNTPSNFNSWAERKKKKEKK